MAGYAYSHLEGAMVQTFLTVPYPDYSPGSDEYDMTLDLIQKIANPIHEHIVSWWNEEGGGVFPDEMVKTTVDDPLSGYLGDKIDDVTIKYDENTFQLYVASVPLATDTIVGGVMIGVQPFIYLQGYNIMLNAEIDPALLGGDDMIPTSRAVKRYVDAAIQGLSGGGSGDMLKVIYDTGDTGVVDDAERLGNQLPAYYLDWANFTGTAAIPGILTVDTINEYTSNAGVTVDGVLIKDGGLSLITGATVDNIETVLTDDDTHIPTSGAVFDAIGSGGSSTFTSNIAVVLSTGKSLGKYLDGDTIPAIGLTAEEVINDIAIEYIDATFSSFSVSGQATTVEVGTTLSGSKTFTWSINVGSGSVSVIDIYDITDSSYIVVDTPHDNTQTETINTLQLNSYGATQQWRGIGTDVTPDPDEDFNSSTFTITGRYYRFYGPEATSVSDSATVRALPSSDFHVTNATFTLNSGSTLLKFQVALPPGRTITQVIDLDALNADITSEYVAQTNINVLDAGSTNRSYNIYEMNVGTPYSTNHRHQITTA